MNTTTQLFAQSDLLEVAGNMLACHETRDILGPGMLELTGISQHGMATVSGLNDYDYQTLQTLSLGHKSLAQMRTVNKSSIPSEILEHFKQIRCHCTMGLFPEIGRAWLTIDSEIYLWTYENMRDVSFYDGLNHLIVSVGLVRPKPNVFVSDVKYMLLLTTPLEIIVLGVTFSSTTPQSQSKNAAYEEMQLMNKPIFIISTDNVSISVVKGSADGRIFLGGRDGCLYEIFYQAESSWFGKRCKKVNHSQGIMSMMMPSFLKVFGDIDPIEHIAIDDSRNLLYVLTEKGTIEAWDMGTDFSNMRRIGKVTQAEIVSAATNIVQTVDTSVFKAVKAICPINKEDCEHIHLIAVTQCGVRLYFSTAPFNIGKYHFQRQTPQAQQQFVGSPQPQQQQAQAQTTQYPMNQQPPIQQISPANPPMYDNTTPGLYLLHVRIPPGYTPNSTLTKPKQVHAAYFNEGTLLMATTPQQEQDLLWSVTSAPFRNSHYLVESTAVEVLDGIVWSLAEVYDHKTSKNRSLIHNARTPKKIAMLTNQGTHVMALLKPVDLLHQLLIACNGAHHDAIRAFFQAQTEREACVTCLLIATSDEHRGSELASWAIQAFMLYGGEPYFPQLQAQMNVNQPQLAANRTLMNTTIASGQQPQHMPYMSTPMPNVAYPGGGGAGGHSPGLGRTNVHHNATLQQTQYPISPIAASQPQPQAFLPGIIQPHANETTAGIVYSAKHDGLYLYVARMMRPFWKLNCINANLCSNLSNEDCQSLLSEICALRNFLDAHSVNDISSTQRNSFSNQTGRATNGYSTTLLSNNNLPVNEQRNVMEQAHAEEKRSLTALNHYIKHACEVIGLWHILTKNQFQLVISQLSADQQHLLKSCTFRDLTLTRSEVCAFLIISLINCFLKDSASVSVLSSNLREICPNLYRHEDAVTYKATEILMSAKNCESVAERQQKLRTALKMCKEAAPTLPLHSICQQFTNAEFYEGVIDLAATCAAKSDTEEFGIHYYNNDEPTEDREGYTGYAARMSAYKEIRIMLDHVYQFICNVQEKQEETSANNRLEIDKRTTSAANAQIMKIINQVLHVKDPLAHLTVYEWLLAHDMLSELLNLVEPSLGEFLRRNATRNPENIHLIDLLWKYYEKNAHHSQAARILDNLAAKPNVNICLDRRIEYLVRAVMCMRNESVGSSSGSGVLLKELEDKLDIARIQKSVLRDMSELAHTKPEAAKAVNDLNNTLYDITHLYQAYAEPFELWECQLHILNCSHHNDPLLIESVWSNIINKAVDTPGSTYERSTRLFTKIETLVRDFGETGHCFPFAFLIRELEIKACQMRLPEGTVPKKLATMNLDVELILEYYSRMISMNERVWANEGNESHLIQSAICVVTELCNNAHNIWYRSKRRILSKAQDLVGLCMNICYQKANTAQVRKPLQELQCRLQRLISS